MTTDFGKRLKAAREHAGLTQEQLRLKAGIAQSTLAAAEAKGHGSRKTPQLATACGVNAHWLATGEGYMLDTPGPSPDRVPPEKGAHNERPQALNLSQRTPNIGPITIEWESIMSGPLPPEFKLALADDALAPDYPAGALFVWSTTRFDPSLHLF